MKNKIKAFQSKVAETLHLQKLSLDIQTKENIESLKHIKLLTFSNEKPFIGSSENMIFFTYSDHYISNSGTSQSVCSLHHPHKNYEDRGYIKGVATDLNGYLALKKAKNMNHNIEPIMSIYAPKFKKSKNIVVYDIEVTKIIVSAIEEMDKYRNQKISEINTFLESFTNCSLLYYIQNI